MFLRNKSACIKTVEAPVYFSPGKNLSRKLITKMIDFENYLSCTQVNVKDQLPVNVENLKF